MNIRLIPTEKQTIPALYFTAKEAYERWKVDLVKDEGSVFQGQRLVNGWKNSSCPWTYKLTTEKLLLPEVPLQAKN